MLVLYNSSKLEKKHFPEGNIQMFKAMYETITCLAFIVSFALLTRQKIFEL